MSLKHLMSDISNISQVAATTDQGLHKKHGLDFGLSLDDPAAVAYLSEASNTATPLIAYLQDLTPTNIKKLVTIMYAGRDVTNFRDAGSLRNFHNDLKIAGVHDKSKEEYIRMVAEKIMNLSLYFSSALQNSAAMGIDPDSDLSHVI